MVQHGDLEAGDVRLRRAGMTSSQKRALFATLGAIGCVALIVLAVVSSSALPEGDNSVVELAERRGMDAQSRMALRRDATEARLRSSERRRSSMLRQFDALQDKIERDLGMRRPQEDADAKLPIIHAQADRARAERPRRMKMAMWQSGDYKAPAAAASKNNNNNKQGLSQESYYEYEPESYQYANDNALPYSTDHENDQAAASLSAAQAQDALHRILALEREANAIRNEMAGRANDVEGARQEIDNELQAVYEATKKAEESLNHAAAVQQQAAETLQSAQDIKNEELARAQRIADIERRLEAEAAYVDQLVNNVEHSGGYANLIAQEAAYSNHAVQSIHNYLEASYALAKALSETGNEARGKLGSDLNAAATAVGDLENENAYGANAAAMSQHYAAAARTFAQHAAGAAQGAYHAVEGALQGQEASVQAAFQAVQAAKGARAAEEVAESARAGAEAAMHMARQILRKTYGYYGPQLPSNPVERAEYLVDRMLPVLSRAADDLERAEGDCHADAVIFEEMRADVKPITEAGENLEMTEDEIKEVQSYADQALGPTLERLMVDMMKAVQLCGQGIVGPEETESAVAPSNEEQEQQQPATDDEVYNKPYDGGVQGVQEENDAAASSAIATAKQLVDSRVSVISDMLDKIDTSLKQGDCQAIRSETDRARNDFNYFEAEEMRVLQGMEPADIDSVDQYAQARLMPLLQTSLDTFDEVKARCGREIFADENEQQQPEEEEAVNPDYSNPSAPPSNDDAAIAAGAAQPENKEAPTTAMVVSSKLVIDHMAKSIDDLMEEVSKDASDCQAADNAGVAFKARFAALEHIALRYEQQMSDAEKAQVEQYAEDKLGSVMEKLFTVVMQVTANCGTKSFDLLGAHDVEQFYEDEARRTLAERAHDYENAQVAEPEGPITNPYGQPLPAGEANPEAEESVNEMKERVVALKKRLEDLRKKQEEESGSASGESGSAASGSGSGSASAAASGSASGGSASSGSAAASSGGSTSGGGSSK